MDARASRALLAWSPGRLKVTQAPKQDSSSCFPTQCFPGLMSPLQGQLYLTGQRSNQTGANGPKSTPLDMRWLAQPLAKGLALSFRETCKPHHRLMSVTKLKGYEGSGQPGLVPCNNSGSQSDPWPYQALNCVLGTGSGFSLAGWCQGLRPAPRQPAQM